MIKDLDFWELFWAISLAIMLLLGIFIVYDFYSSEKHVYSYELSASGTNGALMLRVDIDNSHDDYIPLIGVSYQEAVALRDSLNSK